MVDKVTDFSDLLEYRNSISLQPETPFQKIAIEIIDKAIENLKKENVKITNK